MSIFTCKDCEKRHPGCHGRCRKYKREVEEYAKAKEYLHADDEYIGYFINKVKDRNGSRRRRDW